VLPELLALRTDVPLQGASAALAAQVARERDTLLTFYDAALSRDDPARWQDDLSRVVERDGANPYYRKLMNR
jgi:spermidine synthase